MHLNLLLLSLNDPGYCSLPAYFSVETPASFVPGRFGVTGCKTVIILHTTAHNRIVPINTRANRTFTLSFSPGYGSYNNGLVQMYSDLVFYVATLWDLSCWQSRFVVACDHFLSPLIPLGDCWFCSLPFMLPKCSTRQYKRK